MAVEQCKVSRSPVAPGFRPANADRKVGATLAVRPSKVSHIGCQPRHRSELSTAMIFMNPVNNRLDVAIVFGYYYPRSRWHLRPVDEHRHHSELILRLKQCCP